MTLHEWLIVNRISARDFAAKIGKHESILSRILSGRQAPSYLIVRKVAELTKGEVGLMDWSVPKKHQMQANPNLVPKKVAVVRRAIKIAERNSSQTPTEKSIGRENCTLNLFDWSRNSDTEKDIPASPNCCPGDGSLTRQPCDGDTAYTSKEIAALLRAAIHQFKAGRYDLARDLVNSALLADLPAEYRKHAERLWKLISVKGMPGSRREHPMRRIKRGEK